MPPYFSTLAPGVRIVSVLQTGAARPPWNSIRPTYFDTGMPADGRVLDRALVELAALGGPPPSGSSRCCRSGVMNFLYGRTRPFACRSA